MEFSFWKIALVVIFAILLIVKIYRYFFAPPKLEHLYLELLSPHHWKMGILLKFEIQKRIKRDLSTDIHLSLLSQMKDKGLTEESYVRSKKRSYDLPIRQYRLTETGEFFRDKLLRSKLKCLGLNIK